MNARVKLLTAAIVIAAGCRHSPSLDELPMSHLSTDLESEAVKSPEQRHHMAWHAGARPMDPFPRAEPSRQSLAAHRSRVPEPPVAVVPPTPTTNSTRANDPWAAFRPKVSAAYDTGL